MSPSSSSTTNDNVPSYSTVNDKTARKARRISRACDYCHRRSIRCKVSQETSDGRCQNCIDFGQSCTYNRPAKRRGVRPRSDKNDANDPVGPTTNASVSESANDFSRTTRAGDVRGITAPAKAKEWRAPIVATQSMIVDLVEIYFEVVYPIFPFFHRPTFLRQTSRGEYHTSRFLFASTMAVCALASARARDGAILSPRWKPELLKEPASEVFYVAASKCLPIDLVTARDHNCMRAQALLSITAIQYGQIRTMHQTSARYFCIVAMDGLHDETNWPNDISIVEKEERRRLFWSMYAFDVYTSIVWNGVMRVRETQCDVLYPVEIDDEEFDDSGFGTNISPTSAPGVTPSPHTPSGPIRSTSWLCGWNFTTDLYRIMEHAVDTFRTRRVRLRRQSFLQDIFGEGGGRPQSFVLDKVMHMYANLPQRFKEIQPISLDKNQDRFGFQAANITATIQLLRMVLFSNAGASIADRCDIASEVVHGFMKVPPGYLRAISTPLLHHLGGIGSILIAVFEEPLSHPEYLRVRSVLLSMAQLLANLDTLYSTSSASERLRSQIARMDDFMEGGKDSFSRLEQGPQIAAPPKVTAELVSPVFPAAATTAPLRPVQHFQNQTSTHVLADPALSQYQLPQKLLEDWPWIFDFSQMEE